MSVSLPLVADLLVAVLLVATIATSWRLSGRMARMKADETAMRAVVAELLVATDSAERAIASLSGTVADSERNLAERLRSAEHCAALLARQIAAGDAVIGRVGEIAEISRRVMGAWPSPAEKAIPAPLPVVEDAPPASAAKVSSLRADTSLPDQVDALRATVLAARELAERAARRVAAKAA